MLSAGDRPSTLFTNLVEHVLWQVLSDVGALRLRGERNRRHSILVLSDKLALTAVPGSEQLSGWRSTDETRV